VDGAKADKTTMSSSQNAFLQHLDAAAKEIESVLEKLLSTASLEGELSA
jgi:hypothetical protein